MIYNVAASVASGSKAHILKGQLNEEFALSLCGKAVYMPGAKHTEYDTDRPPQEQNVCRYCLVHLFPKHK